ncbi:MAG TPA: hypothetical protein VFH03_27385 [Actinoplanes sp.]|nr:hypothetical protein [Actinoplanes sp.]
MTTTINAVAVRIVAYFPIGSTVRAEAGGWSDASVAALRPTFVALRPYRIGVVTTVALLLSLFLTVGAYDGFLRVMSRR